MKRLQSSRKFRVRSRRQIEVYFILYLAALLFLLPNKRERAPESDPSLVRTLLSSRFFIVAAKPSLVCQISPVSSSTNVLSLDSVNTIALSGDVTDVHYEFTIEDRSERQIITTISARRQASGIFRMEEDARFGEARFYWYPDLRDRRNRSFNVKVVATARPVVPANIDAATRARLEKLLNDEGRLDTARTEFTISVIVGSGGGNPFDTLIAANGIGVGQAPALTSGGVVGNPAFAQAPFGSAGTLPNMAMRPSAPGEPDLVPRFQQVETYPFQQWENIIQVSGMNLREETRQIPKVFVLRSNPNDNSGNAVITDIRQQSIVLSGTAPSAGGVMQVRVPIVRSADGREFTTEFSVRALPVQRPNIPQKMYPGVEYTFDPALPFITGQELRAVLVEQQTGRERFSSPQAAKFTFAAKESDVGKNFVFTRGINNRNVGENYVISVEEFPAPEILELIPQNTIILVRARCFGQVNGQENRVTIDVGKLIKATIRERYGDMLHSTERQEITQLFELRRTEPDKPISGLIRVIDRKNRASRILTIEAK